MNEDTAPITPDEIEAWRGHVGRSEIRRQVLDIETLRRFAAAIGSDRDVERQAPPLAHWAYFLEAVGPDGLGPDGHPKRGGLLPPVRLPRRMFAASTMRFAEPLTLGREGTLTLTVAEVKHRTGKTGDLVFVEVDRSLSQEGRERVAERQTIVYRGKGDTVAAIQPVALPRHEGEDIWSPGPVDLFRFSAVTFNSHRIHYDLPYAQNDEGYPDLVVQGPFTAVKLYAFARARIRPAQAIRKFTFRANVPLFSGQPVRLTPTGEPGKVEAIRCDGAVAMAAHAEL